MICFSEDRMVEVRQASERSYRVLQYARLVICFSEDGNTGGLQYARLEIGLIKYYSTLD